MGPNMCLFAAAATAGLIPGNINNSLEIIAPRYYCIRAKPNPNPLRQLIPSLSFYTAMQIVFVQLSLAFSPVFNWKEFTSGTVIR